MERGIRHNEGKPQWSQVDFKSLEPMVRVLEYGESRVGKDNWRKGLLVNEVCESLLRHIFAFMDGEDNDQQSGLPHVGHILSNAMFLSHMHLFRPDMDNRGKKKEEPKLEIDIKCENTLSPALDQALEQLRKAIEVRKASEKLVNHYQGGILQNAKVGSRYPKDTTIPFSDEDIFKNQVSWKDLVSDRMGRDTIEVTMSDGSEWIMTRK